MTSRTRTPYKPEGWPTADNPVADDRSAPTAEYGDISDEYLDALDKLLAPEYEKHEFVLISGPGW